VHATGTPHSRQQTPTLSKASILFLCRSLPNLGTVLPEGMCAVKRSKLPINTVDWFIELHDVL
jgi:hypothetical protein